MFKTEKFEIKVKSIKISPHLFSEDNWLYYFPWLTVMFVRMARVTNELCTISGLLALCNLLFCSRLHCFESASYSIRLQTAFGSFF